MKAAARGLASLVACLALGCVGSVMYWGELGFEERAVLPSSEGEGRRVLNWMISWYPEVMSHVKEHGEPPYVCFEKREEAGAAHTLYHLVYTGEDRLVTWDQEAPRFRMKQGTLRRSDELPLWVVGLLPARERDLVLQARALRQDPALAEVESQETYASGYARRLAVVIGIDAYATFPDLEGGADDARAVADALRERGFDRVVELYDGEATRDGILASLAADSPLAVSSEDLLLIYFAGHGATEVLPDAGQRGYIVPVDGRPGALAQSAISMQTLREVAGRLPAKHVLYALDSCFSGLGLARASAQRIRPQNYYQKMTSLRAIQIVTAGREGETALEQDGRGVFTLFLLQALSGEADVDGDGFVTGSELGAYLPSRVSAFTQGRQTPRYGTLLGSGDVAFGVPR
jgi:hypothetical protein